MSLQDTVGGLLRQGLRLTGSHIEAKPIADVPTLVDQLLEDAAGAHGSKISLYSRLENKGLTSIEVGAVREILSILKSAPWEHKGELRAHLNSFKEPLKVLISGARDGGMNKEVSLFIDRFAQKIKAASDPICRTNNIEVHVRGALTTLGLGVDVLPRGLEES